MSPELNKVLNKVEIPWKDPQICFIKGNTCQVLLYSLKTAERKSKRTKSFHADGAKYLRLKKATILQLSSKGELMSQEDHDFDFSVEKFVDTKQYERIQLIQNSYGKII